jgi:ABC-type spermidine/putrescine transport system permease subunit II
VIELVVTVLVAIGTAACGAFIVLYHRWHDWSGDHTGRHLMATQTAIGVVLLAVLAFRLWGDYPGRQAVVTIAFGWVVFSLCQRVVMLVRFRRQSTDRRSQT